MRGSRPTLNCRANLVVSWTTVDLVSFCFHIHFSCDRNIRSRLPDLRATGNGGWRRSASNVELSALMPVPSNVYSHDAEHADEPHVPRRPPITAQMEAGCTLSTGPPRLVSTLHRAPCDRIKSQSVAPLVLQYHLLLLLSVPLFYFHTFQVVDRLCYPFFRPTLLFF